MSVQDAGKEALASIAKTRPDSVLLVAAIVFLVWHHGREVSELSNQVKAINFMMGISDCETPECRDRFITTFTDWIELRKSGCE